MVSKLMQNQLDIFLVEDSKETKAIWASFVLETPNSKIYISAEILVMTITSKKLEKNTENLTLAILENWTIQRCLEIHSHASW